MKGVRLLAALLAVHYGHASETVFSVNDDILAFPQFEIIFSESYILEKDAISKLKGSIDKDQASTSDENAMFELSAFRAQNDQSNLFISDDSQPNTEVYERMVLKDRPYFCTISQPNVTKSNKTEEAISKDDLEKELARAADRGWELLQDMEGMPCLFFSTDWWTYSFCYNSQIKQFHSLAPGTNGAPVYPPTEDPTTPSYILGKFEPSKDSSGASSSSSKTENQNTDLQTKADTRYLVRRLGGGTPCDLTGKDRKVEVQFHCHPQSTDRIGWIKETATCNYLMIIYTPRLCHDVAFLPPREVKANPIICQEILKPGDISEWETRKTTEATRKMIGQGLNQRPVVGGIEIGGMKEVGREGRRIEKGRVVSTPEERAETVAAQRNGKIEGLSKADLRKRNINPDAVEAFRKELQQQAGSRDWKIQIWDEADGQVELRGIIASDSESEKAEKSDEEHEREGDEGSEETYKENT